MATNAEDKRVEFSGTNATTATQIVAGVASMGIKVREIYVEIDNESDKSSSMTCVIQDDNMTPRTIVPSQTIEPGNGPLHIVAKSPYFIGQTQDGDDLDIVLGAAANYHGYVVYNDETAN